jgi:hypothetical protein
MRNRKSRSSSWQFASVVLAAGLLTPAALAQPNGSPDPSVRDPTSPPLTAQRPLTREERFHWFIDSTIGPKSLAAGGISAAWGTAWNNPEEYGPHWDGFAKRYGMRLTGIATSNAIEAGLGSAWREDPRYSAVLQGSVWSRVGHAAKMTLFTNRADGSIAPAYARYAGITGGNFLSNTWRVESESTTGSALKRSGLGFAGSFVSNIFDEFWPDLRRKLFARQSDD